MTDLAATLAEVRERIQRAPKGKLNEQNTKASLIEPVLRALGWNPEDFDEVQREYRLKKRDKPVDYGLLIVRTPRLFIEAKGLGENLDDRRWANQIMGYATVAGVEWIVLTDGDEYRIYNAHAPVHADEKLFRSVRVSDDGEMAIQTLALLAKDRMEENAIEVLWRAEFVDRQVGSAVEQLFTAENDMLLVNYIASRTKNLTVPEIRSSIARCKISLDFPIQPSTRAKKPVTRRKQKPRSAPAAKSTTTVADLIHHGLISPPADLMRTYKGVTLKARVEKDGAIRFGRDLFASPSMAAGAARATIIGLRKNGRVPNTNGWSFWRVTDASGKERSLGELRSAHEADREAAG